MDFKEWFENCKNIKHGESFSEWDKTIMKGAYEAGQDNDENVTVSEWNRRNDLVGIVLEKKDEISQLKATIERQAKMLEVATIGRQFYMLQEKYKSTLHRIGNEEWTACEILKDKGRHARETQKKLEEMELSTN